MKLLPSIFSCVHYITKPASVVLAFGTQVRGLKPGQSRKFKKKNPEHALLRRGSKAVGPVS